MDKVELLKLIKFKLFQHKKIVSTDSSNKKVLVDSWSGDHVDSGWDVADRTYVENRIVEEIRKLKLPAPSAPSKNILVNRCVLLSVGEILATTECFTFFNPGLVLKKDWIISEITLFTDKAFNEDITLSIKDIATNKSHQISKITKNKQSPVFTSETNYTIDKHKTVVFTLQPQQLFTKINMQLILEF